MPLKCPIVLVYAQYELRWRRRQQAAGRPQLRWQSGGGGVSTVTVAAVLQRRWQRSGGGGVTKLEYFGTYLRYLPTNPTSQHCDSDLDIRSHFLSRDITFESCQNHFLG